MEEEKSIDIKAVFAEALERQTLEERAAYLDEACLGNHELRVKVEALLEAHGKAGSFLEPPSVGAGATLNNPAKIDGPGTTIGRYALLELLGEGGMGLVYLAEQKEPVRRKVALKIIKPGMDSKQVIARFEAERQALALLDHPNIAHVFDAGCTETGRPYFVMELVAGVSITEYCDKNNLSTKDRLALFLQVCQAVQHAHQKGIIHRDIKPSNVMVTHHDGKPVPKVIDFGIAKATNQRLTEKTLFTRYAHIIGTPAYMSPEQAELSDLDIDTRSDIYSLGVLLYELLTGTTPFSEEELRKAGYIEMQRVIREQEPAKPSTKLSTLGETLTDIAKHRRCTPDLLRKAIRGDLDWIVMKSLEKDRARRYETASSLATDIRRHIEHEPVLARGPSTTYRLRKFLRRHRVSVTVATALAVTLVAGFVISTSLYVRVKRAQDHVATLESQMETDRKLSTAQRLYAEGRYQAALQEVETNLLKESSDPKTRLLHAQLLCDVGRTADAERELLTLVDGQPEVAAAAYYLLARINVGTDPTRAAEHQRLAESLLPHTPDAYVLRAVTADTPDDAIDWLSKALEQDPAHYGARKARALAFYGLRDYAKMLQDVEVIIVMRPRDSLGYSLRAIAKREQGELQQAIHDHNRAIELCGVGYELAMLHDQRQETYWRMKQYQAALQDAQRCVALDPGNSSYIVALARALFGAGEYEAAQQEFDQIHAKGEKAMLLALGSMVRYALDAASAGEPLGIPESIAQRWPFRHMLSHVQSHRALEQKATRLVRGVWNSSSWSPDGRKLAYGRCEYCGWDTQTLSTGGPAIGALPRGIEILDIESGRIRVLVTHGAGPAWSPDGKYIAFYREPGFLRDYEQEIWLIPAAGGQAKRLARGGCPFWTNNPTRLYFHSRTDQALCYIDIEDHEAKPVEVAACPALYPNVSPDERFLAYATAGEMKVVELSSGKEVVKWAVPGCEEYCTVVWSPDGKEIGFSALGRFYPVSGLWIYDVEQKTGRHLFDPMAMCCNWTRDRSRVAIDVLFPVSEIWVADMKPGSSTAEAFAPVQTRAEYLRERWELYAGMVKKTQTTAVAAQRVLANLTSVGVNQYECGEYEDALWTLQQVAELRQAKGLRPDIKTSSHIVMVLQRTGRRQEATEALHQLRQTYEQTRDPNDARFLDEVEQFIAGDDSRAY